MQSDTFETYYMVMREDGNAYSQVRHATESDARFEAQRLCQKTGKTEDLQVAHFWRRNILRTRWELDNACLLQKGIHLFWAHSHFQEFTAFWLQRLGQEKYLALELKARYVGLVSKDFLVFTNYDLKEDLKRLQEKGLA